MADTVGMQDIRGLNVNKIVTGFALEEFTFKQIVRVGTSSKWQERYYKETAADLTATAPSVIKGVSRLSTFPRLEVSWTQVNSYQIKHAVEDFIALEDIEGNDVMVLERTLLRIARAIGKSVNDHIYTSLSDDSDINTTAATGTGWDDTTNGDPVYDLLTAQRKVAENNYNPYNNSVLLVNPQDWSDFLRFLITIKGSSIPQFASKVVQTGAVMNILGTDIMVSNSVTADEALFVIKNECGNYLEFNSLRTVVIDSDSVTAGIGKLIKAWEIGVVQVTNPKAIATITDTQT